MKNIVLIVTMISLTSLAKAYECNAERFNTCFNLVKPEILSSIEGATQVRFGLSSRSDGFNNLLLTYTMDGKPMMSVIYIQDTPCASAFVASGDLTSDLSEIKKRSFEMFPNDIEYMEGFVKAFGADHFYLKNYEGQLSEVKSTFAKSHDIVLELNSAYDTKNKVYTGQVRHAEVLRRTPIAAGSMFLSSEINSVKCTDSSTYEFVLESHK